MSEPSVITWTAVDAVMLGHGLHGWIHGGTPYVKTYRSRDGRIYCDVVCDNDVWRASTKVDGAGLWDVRFSTRKSLRTVVQFAWFMSRATKVNTGKRRA